MDKLSGDAAAKERLRVVLETLAGTCRVSDACQRLNISEQRFDQVRVEALQAALAALAPKPLGRPPRTTSPAEAEAEQLRARVAELEAQLHVAAVRTEVAAILPHTAAAAEKKMP
ncbi:MAG TPA: helix-turn-helix domain-containing protein [Solirubrobacteraceae bacterium]